MKTITRSKKSKTAFSNFWRCANSIRNRAARFCVSSGRRASAKPSIGKSIARASGPRIYSRFGRRHSRRSRNSRPSPHLYRLDAGPHYRRDCAASKSKIRFSCWTKSTNSARDYRGDPTFGASGSARPRTKHRVFRSLFGSAVRFVAKSCSSRPAIMLDPIPPALRDRLEVLRFPGYTEIEKRTIARQFLIPKQMKENGITARNIVFSDDGVTQLIRDYTREAGVRNLEREIGTVCRKVARGVAQAEDGKRARKQVTRSRRKFCNDLSWPAQIHLRRRARRRRNRRRARFGVDGSRRRNFAN